MSSGYSPSKYSFTPTFDASFRTHRPGVAIRFLPDRPNPVHSSALPPFAEENPNRSTLRPIGSQTPIIGGTFFCSRYPLGGLGEPLAGYLLSNKGCPEAAFSAPEAARTASKTPSLYSYYSARVSGGAFLCPQSSFSRIF